MDLKRTIQRLDVLKMIPEEFKESSYIGVLLSAVFICLAGILLVNQTTLLLSTKLDNQILVDHLKDDKDLVVNMELLVHRYPCALACLDKLDAVHTHTMDIRENLRRYRTDRKGNVIEEFANDAGLSVDQRIDAAREQINNNEGCLLGGNFTVKLVPGNFHFSFHKYGMELQFLMSRENFRPDFSHEVRQLSFGDQNIFTEKQLKYDFGLDSIDSLNGHSEGDLMGDLGFPHGVMHQMNIIPSQFEYTDGRSYEMYQYSAASFRMSGGGMAITFKFNIENIYMHYKMKKGSISHFFIQSIVILGGTYMLLTMLKVFVEDGVLGQIYKRRIGKLE